MNTDPTPAALTEFREGGWHQCKRCGEHRPTDQFPKDQQCKRGVRSVCKLCVNARARELPVANRPKVPAICVVCSKHFMAVKWDVDHGGGKCCSRDCVRSLGNMTENPGRFAKSKTYPAKAARRAYKLVNKALADGTITRRPCKECGSVDSHAHHEDYSRPLDVIWLCRTHHNQLHDQRRGRKADEQVEPIFTEFTHQGWPLCPKCGENELWSPFHPPIEWDLEERQRNMALYIASGLTCYQCGWSMPPQPITIHVHARR